MADLLTVSHLKKYFSVKGGDEGETTLKAVDDISFSIAEGETLGLVGESGCGKSTSISKGSRHWARRLRLRMA